MSVHISCVLVSVYVFIVNMFVVLYIYIYIHTLYTVYTLYIHTVSILWCVCMYFLHLCFSVYSYSRNDSAIHLDD